MTIKNKISLLKIIIAILFVGTKTNAFELTDLDFDAAGWIQYGVIEKSSDSTARSNFNGKSILSAGSQFSLKKNITPSLALKIGVGAVASHTLAAKTTVEGGYAPMNVSPYVSEASFTYQFYQNDESELILQGGQFTFDYAKENQNLGLYLLRGPVYPGYVYSGFETKHVLPIANLLGLHLHHRYGNFYQDLIMSSETELTPFFDISPSLITGYEIPKTFRFGVGVNFYHFIPIDDKVTNNPKWFYAKDTLHNSAGVPLFDSTNNPIMDTVFLSFQGIKLMANTSIDFKSLFGGMSLLGPEDLKLYGEISLLGLGNSKAIRELYGSYSKRMPKMIGFNLPAFNWLDHLSLELEWYNAPFRDNLEGFKNTADESKPSPIPYSNTFDNWTDKDNFKFSIHAAKTFQNHIRFSLQIANDHYRPLVFEGYGDNSPSSKQAVMLRSPNGFNLFSEDWYWMSKVAYFF